jgi:hypothetical protein
MLSNLALFWAASKVRDVASPKSDDLADQNGPCEPSMAPLLCGTRFEPSFVMRI